MRISMILFLFLCAGCSVECKGELTRAEVAAAFHDRDNVLQVLVNEVDKLNKANEKAAK